MGADWVPDGLTERDLLARAEAFGSYSLLRGTEVLLRLQYVHNPHVEDDGGLCFRCEYAGEPWELQVFRRGLGQQRSYRVLCGGMTIVRFSERWLFPAELEFSDGVRLRCVPGLYRTTVRDADGRRVAVARRRWSGSLAGSAKIWMDPETDWVRGGAIALLLLHLSTS